ncbi:formylglycine-generating enzyme family protein [Candidatus Poribacteria bacterium]|nr:formylglycine-generating enzyme family protein [Candidatus Poribacteria bacterium]
MKIGLILLIFSSFCLSASLLSENHNDTETVPIPDGMVLIPAGEFQMGSKNGDRDEKPIHTVHLDAFYIDEHEITVGEYKKFIKATGHRALSDSVFRCSPTDQHPVVSVSWHDAMAYAQSVGKRLPTEAEWEKAARGGLIGQKYPWGNVIDTSKANYNKNTKSGTHDEQTTPVGKYRANKYRLFDMSGNVSEWCLDAYQKNFYAKSPQQNPIAGAERLNEVIDNFQNIETRRVVRGGSWSFNAKSVRVANRMGEKPSLLSSDVGFRCVRNVKP